MNTPRVLWIVCTIWALFLNPLAGRAQPVTAISAGGSHTLFLKRGGSLWSMGDNGAGELGFGNEIPTNRPQQILSSNVTVVAAGWLDSLFLKSDGSLWAMGYDVMGELGDGDYVGSRQPELIESNGVTAVAAGFWHSLFLRNDGSLWGMGGNGVGQLGGLPYNGNYAVTSPGQIVASNVTTIATGYEHSLFLKNDGSLWVMGANQYGELGDGTDTNANQPEQIEASNVVAIAGGTGYQAGHSLFLKSDGSLWGMGYNADGELGDGTFNNTNRPELLVSSNVTAIAAGYYHSLFLKCDGSLWAMGRNNLGQLGDGTFNNANRPEQIVAGGVVAIAGGGNHSLFLKRDGSLWAMGMDNSGQLGDGTTIYGLGGNYTDATNQPEQILAPYNRISGQSLGAGSVRLSFVGIGGANYALDRSSSLSSPNWTPQTTNPASSFGTLVFTNTPNPAANNFWRVRSVP